ncbi:VOC family protein [Kribbella qitaiheensis]|uniref:VOC family protein n=1 Tax=Kribbella qitaiheensis TaxID=1544730 RepID=A0A7G6WX80_9ACTN|nr:VOC family protein [Kribbella qitaiheensis]QNE18595.1 VOC family protein [Kribbella qitaiheensis]
MTTTWTMTIDCTDPAAQAAFWCLALGYREADPPRGWDSWEAWLTDQGVPEDEWNDGANVSDPEGVLPSISFLKVPERRTVKNRLHLDLQVSGGRDQPSDVREQRIRQKAAELIEVGATVVHEAEQNGKLDHLWMADPEGNDFCVV